MNDENEKGPQCSDGRCAHGMCLNHKPEWEDVGKSRLEPVRGIFGEKFWWSYRCCGKRMAQMKETQTRQCKRCGRRKDDVVTFAIAYCRCCGRHFRHEFYFCG